MKKRKTLVLLLLAVLPGCDVNVHKYEREPSHRYTPPPYGGYQEELHTLQGSFDIRDRHTGAPIRNADISVRLLRDGRVQDRFSLRTNTWGMATFEQNATGPAPPYDRMEYALKKDGYRLVHDSTPIRWVDTVRDPRGAVVRIYQTSVRIWLD